MEVPIQLLSCNVPLMRKNPSDGAEATAVRVYGNVGAIVVNQSATFTNSHTHEGILTLIHSGNVTDGSRNFRTIGKICPALAWWKCPMTNAEKFKRMSKQSLERANTLLNGSIEWMRTHEPVRTGYAEHCRMLIMIDVCIDPCRRYHRIGIRA